MKPSKPARSLDSNKRSSSSVNSLRLTGGIGGGGGSGFVAKFAISVGTCRILTE